MSQYTFSDNDITDIIDETFTVTEERFGEVVTIELKPDGAAIPVTEDNKAEYVECIAENRISRRVQEQFMAFMSGFTELVPLDLVTVFDERELELLIGGMSEVCPINRHQSSILTLNRLMLMTGPNTRTIVATSPRMKSSSGSGNAYAVGTLKGNRDFCNSQPGHPEYLSTASKIFKALMAPAVSRSKSLETRDIFRRAIHVRPKPLPCQSCQLITLHRLQPH